MHRFGLEPASPVSTFMKSEPFPHIDFPQNYYLITDCNLSVILFFNMSPSCVNLVELIFKTSFYYSKII